MREKIWLDVDEVLVNLRDPMSEALAAETGMRLSWEQWTDYNLVARYKLSLTDFFRVLYEHKVLQKATTEPGVVQAIRTWHADGVEVCLLTARGWHPEGEALTRAWLAKEELPIETVCVIDTETCKGDVLKTMGPAMWFVDDALHHVQAVADKTRVPVAVQDRPWNRHAQSPGLRLMALSDLLNQPVRPL